MTEDRPCSQCIWHSDETGCFSWDCEPVTRQEAKNFIRDNKELVKEWKEKQK